MPSGIPRRQEGKRESIQSPPGRSVDEKRIISDCMRVLDMSTGDEKL